MSKWFVFYSDSECAESLWGYHLVEADRDKVDEYCKALMVQYVSEYGLTDELDIDEGIEFPSPIDDVGERVGYYAQFYDHHTAVVAVPFDTIEAKTVLSGSDLDKTIAEITNSFDMQEV